MPHRKNGEIKMWEIFEVFFVGWICPGGLSEARSEAKKVEAKLQSDNPILRSTSSPKLRITYYDDYNSPLFPVCYGMILSSEEVKRIEVDFDKARYNPDDYFKPLDIAMICRKGIVHACMHIFR